MGIHCNILTIFFAIFQLKYYYFFIYEKQSFNQYWIGELVELWHFFGIECDENILCQ